MRGNRWRVYISAFNDLGAYQPYVEVTDDVELDSLGSIASNLDNTNYDIGIYRNANMNITFRNDNGKYSDVGQPTSIFRYKRKDSLIKVTWSGEDRPQQAGFFQAGDITVAPETTMFIGLLNDESLSMDLDTQKLPFIVMGRESIFNRVTVPLSGISSVGQTVTVTLASPGVFTTPSPHDYAIGNPISFSTTGALPTGLTAGTPYYVISMPTTSTFTVSSSLGGGAVNTSGSQSGVHTINNLFGTLLSTAIFNCLNQSPITALLTVSAPNIIVGTDSTIDSSVDLQNKTVWQALADLLLISNSVLYVQNDTIFVSTRTPTASVKFKFFGQSSIVGPENVQNIRNIKSGSTRMFNRLSWKPSEAAVQDSSSISKFGTLPKEFSQTEFQDTTKQIALLTSILNEFSLPKQEFDLYTPLDYQSLAINLLDRTSIDYPPLYLPGDSPFPICGVAICGQGVLPNALWSFTVNPADHYKVIGKMIDPQLSLVMLHMRLI